MSALRRSLSVVALAALATACDGGTPSQPDTAGPPARLDIVSGDAQQGAVGTELPQPLVVKVVDAKGKPVEGQVINFRVVSGGGIVFAGSALTNKDGEARERWTLGTVAADSQRVEARAVDPATGAPLVFGVFRAVAAAGPATAIQAVSPTSVAGGIGAAVADSLAVKVVDAYGNPISGASVSWQAGAGSGSLSPATSTTGANGVAKTRWTLGAAIGAEQATATTGSLAPVTFTAQAGAAGAALAITLNGNHQSATVGTVLAPLSVKVTLADGTPVAGAQVVTPSSTTVPTDAQGVAALPAVTLSTRSGLSAYEVGIVIGGVRRDTSFVFTGLAGPAAVVMNIGRFFQFTPSLPGTTYTPSIIIGDQYYNPVKGASVTWAVTRGTGSVSPVTALTDSLGVAVTTWTIGAYVAGNDVNEVTGTMPGVGSVTWSANPTEHAYTIAITPASPDTVRLSVGDTVALGVKATDETGVVHPSTDFVWSWGSENAAIVKAQPLGDLTTARITAVAPGTTRVYSAMSITRRTGYTPPTFIGYRVIVVQ